MPISKEHKNILETYYRVSNSAYSNWGPEKESPDVFAIHLGYIPDGETVFDNRVAVSRTTQLVVDTLGVQDGNKLPLNAFLSLLEESGKTKNLDYLVMDFLGGRDFSVDCLCKDGKPLFIIPRTRINAMGGVSLIGEFTDDLEVRKQVEKVIKVANGGAGINLLYLGIKLVSGKPIPNKNNLKYHGVKMVRYWEQMYIKTNKQFNP